MDFGQRARGPSQLQAPTHGETIEAAKRAACEAIRINLEAYREAGQPVPGGQNVSNHLENPEFRDLLDPDVPDGDWYKDFGTFKLCGTGRFPSTFLMSGQPARGKRL